MGDRPTTKFTTAIAGGTTPDVAEVGTTWTAEFGQAGALTDLTADVKAAACTEMNTALASS